MSWDKQYKDGQGRYWPNEELVRMLGRRYGQMKILKYSSGLNAVEIGCGVGGNMQALVEWGFFVRGLDSSLEALKLAQEFMSYKRWSAQTLLEEYKAPATIKVPAGSVQLVVDVQTIQHLTFEEHDAMYAEIYRVLAPGGRFFSYHWAGDWQDAVAIFPAHPELKRYKSRESEEEINAQLYRAGFSIEYEQYVEKTYMKMNLGRWAVIEAVKG